MQGGKQERDENWSQVDGYLGLTRKVGTTLSDIDLCQISSFYFRYILTYQNFCLN